MTNFCDKCGEQVKVEDHFCNNCGSKLTSSKTWIEPDSTPKASPAPISPPMQQKTTTRPKRFYRSKQDRWITGVAGGLGEYFDIDPILIRIGFILLAIIGYGTGILLYIVLAIFVEENPYQEYPDTNRRSRY
jgi:phage shock protein PspC (stress-responsive transcriptional regulator)